MTRRLLPVLLAAILAGAGWFAWPRPQEPVGYQGYVEGHLVFMAPEAGGRIETLAVEAGDRVAAGQPLFTLESAMQAAQHQEASAKLRQAQAQLADQEAALRRPEEIAVLQAQETRARAQLDLSRGEFERQRTLFLRGYSAQARLDQAQAAFERDEAALQEILRQIEASRIAGRSGEIVAARAAVQAAEAAVNQAGTHLARRRVAAPQDAQVQDVYFRPGEVVNAGQPVLALLPSDGRRLRFYVPEPALASLALGQTVGFDCDSCPDGLRARITFIAREAEFTPPVIFSERERAKLVFRAEATPEGGLDLPLGLPVTVAPGAPGS